MENIILEANNYGGPASNPYNVADQNCVKVRTGVNYLDWLSRKDGSSQLKNENIESRDVIETLADDSYIKEIDEKAKEVEEAVSTLKNVNALMSKILLEEENNKFVEFCSSCLKGSGGPVEIESPSSFLLVVVGIKMVA